MNMLCVGGGTGTLTKHLRNAHGITKENYQGDRKGKGKQTQLHGYAESLPGGGMPFMYNRDRMIDEFAKYVIAEELPFNHGESTNLEYFNRVALQPLYRRIPRTTLLRRTQQQYKAAMSRMRQMFLTLDTRVCLTTDTWTSVFDEPFMCVTAHWVDENWYLQKRIISFEVMYESHSGINIKTRLMNVCNNWNLFDKIFSISVDNVTANTKAIDYLKADTSLPKILDGIFFHIRCCAHVLNLCAQEGLKELHPLIGPVREVIKWVRSKPECKREYRRKCKSAGLRSLMVPLDCKTRWNSTFKMLSYAVKYRDILSSIYNTRVDAGKEVTPEQWEIAFQVCNLLKPFYDATKIFSLMYEPNVHLVLGQACVVLMIIKQNLDHPRLSGISRGMLSKWLDYFKYIPPIYTIAQILDPNVNINGTRNLLFHYYRLIGIVFDVDGYIADCKKCLVSLCTHYDSIYNPSADRSTRPVVPPPHVNPLLVDVIFTYSGSSNSSSSSFEELNDYLSCRWDPTADFKILPWWKFKSDKYPILSRIARDILSVPASTVASESAFSAGRRVLDDKRSRLTPDNIQMCVCKKDWDQADKRTQGLKEQEDEDSDDPMMCLASDSEGVTGEEED